MALQTKAKKLKPSVSKKPKELSIFVVEAYGDDTARAVADTPKQNNATVQAYIQKIQAQTLHPGEWEAFWKQMEPKPEAA